VIRVREDAQTTRWDRVAQRVGRGHSRVGGAVVGIIALLVITVTIAVVMVTGGSGGQSKATASAGSSTSQVAAPAAVPAPAAVVPAPATVGSAPAAVPAPAAVVPAPATVGSAPGEKSAPGGLGRSVPVRLQIPSIGVNSDLMSLGLQGNGTIQVPPSGFPAGWFTGAPTPGQIGPAVIAGHVDWGGSEGVFFNLRDMKNGDKVEVARADGSTVVFHVSAVEEYPKDAFPTNQVYGDLDHPGLRLITCGGSFDRTARSYVDNIVVYADL